MAETDKLTDMVYEDAEVRKSVEKRRDFRENVEVVENVQAGMITNEVSGKGIAFYFSNNNKVETNKDKDTRYGEDAYKERHGTEEIIKSTIRRKRGKRRGKKNFTRQKTVKFPPTPCIMCEVNVNIGKSVPCKDCKKYIHLKEKCSGLESEEQYNLDYRCPRCINDTDEPEINNNLNELIENVKTNGRKRKTTENEGLPEKLSPFKKINKITEKDTSEIKPTDGEETRKEITPNQMSDLLTTIEGIKITEADRMSLENGKNVTCTIITLFIKKFGSNNKGLLEKNKILLIEPSIVQLLQLQGRVDVKEQKEHLNMKQYDWVLFPINNRENPMEGDGGKHYSLVIFNKKEHRFLHFDPLNGFNKKNALDLMTNLMDRESVISEGNTCKLPDFEEANCAKQQNGYDCGPFILGFMVEAIDKINQGGVPSNLSAPIDGALAWRNGIAEFIDKRIIKNPKSNEKSDLMIDNAKKPNSNETVVDANESIEMTCNRLEKLLGENIEIPKDKKYSNNVNDKNRAQNTIEAWKTLGEIMSEESDLDKQKPNKNDSISKERNKDNHKDTNKTTYIGNKIRGRGCRYHINDSCRYGKQCRYTHREVCSGWKRNGNCGNSKCTFDHPEPCMNHLKGSCPRRICWFLHTLERANPKPEVQQKGIIPVQKQQKHNEVGGSKNHNQNFWNGPNQGQEIQKKKMQEEMITTQQQSIHLMMGAMETLRIGLEQILLKTNKQ